MTTEPCGVEWWYDELMARKRSWTDEELTLSVKSSRSYRAVLIKLRLVPAGGNYEQVKRRIKELSLDTAHFTGMHWNTGMKYHLKATIPVENLLVRCGKTQSYKLKNKLFSKGLKKPQCELCGWAERSADGRVPVELDHINGDKYDNRIKNLRILCPNCHSLQLTHRGKNKRVSLARVL